MKYDLNGVHVLNKFLWERLVAAGIMKVADYQGLVPIIPTQQEPVFTDMASGRPFIVYTYLVNSYDVDIWSNVEQVTYIVYSDDERKLRQISNFISDLCKRFDWSANDINTWLDTYDSTDGDEAKFEFKFLQVMGQTSPEPYEQEGGRQNSSVTVRLAYTHLEDGRIDKPTTGMRS